MVFPKGSLATKVEAVSIESELGNFRGRPIKVVACVESIIASEPPCPGMELLGSGLDHGSDRCSR